MKNILFIVFSLCCANSFGQTLFEKYLIAKPEERPKIFADFISQTTGYQASAAVIYADDITTIEDEIVEQSIRCFSLDSAMSAIEEGNKVLFFIDTYVWGRLEEGTTKSTSWDRYFPYSSGFYLFKSKSFQNEGLNFHCGTKEKNNNFRFYIFKK